MSLRALDGFVIGVTADRRWKEQAELLERRGAVVVHGPTIKTEYLASDDVLRSATQMVIARRPDYLVATTGIGVRAWFEAAQAWGEAERLLDALTTTKVGARGPKAGAAVNTAGLPVWASPDSERLDDVIARLRSEPLAGRTVAFQHYGEHNASAVAALVAAGAEVIEVPIYRWRAPDDVGPARRLVNAVCAGRVDAVTFTSAPAVHNFVDVARAVGQAEALIDAFNHRGVLAACIGPVCAEGARAHGVRHPLAPGHGRLGLLVRAVTDALHQRRQWLTLAGQPVVVQGRALRVGDELIDLPEREGVVFRTLLARRSAVVPKTALLRSLGEGVTPHALEATIARLRRRMGAAGAAIRAVRGRGYVLDAG